MHRSARLAVALVALAGLLLSLPVAAQTNDAVTRMAVGSDTEGLLRLHLMDGSVLTGKLAVSELTVTTAYGKLVIPVTDVVRITPGMTSHPELHEKVTTLIKQLGSDVFDEREDAQRKLAELGPTVRLLLEQSLEDADQERRTRVEKLLEEFDAMSDEFVVAEDVATMPIPELDSVETPTFTAVGKIAPEQFEIDSSYGKLTVKLTDIRHIVQATLKESNIRRSITVAGADIAQKQFKPTSIRVNRGDQVIIKASGQITMTPWGGGAMSTPDGSTNYGWYENNTIEAGALVAKIGTGGTIFKVGSDKTFVADRDGVLMFAVGMNPSYANQAMPGEYKVNVVVRRP